jgi:hypothetical protein
MPKYVIDREVRDAGHLTAEQLRELSAQSNGALRKIGDGVQWVHSYVTGSHLFCVYNAENEDLIREHARIGGFPCDRIHQVSAVIDPVTGE